MTGGSAPYQGILEIFVNEQWGTVCDDYFGSDEAIVACSQLGYTGYYSYSSRQSGDSSAPIFMDDVDCSYSVAQKGKDTKEKFHTRLADCAKKDTNVPFTKGTFWKIHNCDHSEDVFLNCYSSGTYSQPSST